MKDGILTASVADLRRDRTSLKWRRYPQDVLPLWVAEMDASQSSAVVAAVCDAMRRGDTGYPWSPDYLDAFADFAARQWDWRFAASTALTVPDVMGGIARLLEAITDPAAPVVLSSPAYNAFFSVIESIGRTSLDAPLTPDGRLDETNLADAFARATSGARSAAYLLSNPHNPAGTVHSPDELAMLARVAGAHGVTVISDEIHAALVYGTSTFTPYLSVPGTERGITVTSASKAWNLAGLKAALVVPGSEARSAVGRVHEFVTFGASHLGVIAQAAAWSHGGDWLRQLLAELEANRQLLATLVAERLPGVRMRVPEATYLAWLDCRELGLGDNPALHFLDKGRVALSEGPHFGTGGRGHVRLNFATSPEILRDAIDRMARSLE
jgi:cystathionine beta-lyase